MHGILVGITICQQAGRNHNGQHSRNNGYLFFLNKKSVKSRSEGSLKRSILYNYHYGFLFGYRNNDFHAHDEEVHENKCGCEMLDEADELLQT